MRNLLLDRIKKQIDAAKIVSFDVFDTLLLRPYLKPTDLFRHLEKIENKPYFSLNRISAERLARVKNTDQEDVTLDEIYSEIDNQFASLKEKELALEKSVLFANPEALQVFNYAKQEGKTIVLVSDMYLPSDFIEEVLKKNGFASHERLYLSCELRKTKSSGSLFSHILTEQHVQPKEMLHIGDNKRSDYKNAKQLGICAVFYPKVCHQYLKSNKRARIFYRETRRELGSSVLISLLAQKWQADRVEKGAGDYWSKLGFQYAGPLAYGYSRFLEREATELGVDALLFIARDGFTLKKVFERFNSKLKTEYIYAPRFLNLICRLDYAKGDAEQAQAIVDYFKDEYPSSFDKVDDKNSQKSKQAHEFIEKNKPIFRQLAGEEFDNYKKYLEKYTREGNNFALADTVTGEFSSQRLLSAALFPSKRITGLYWSIIRKKTFEGSFDSRCFIRNEYEDAFLSKVFTRNWDFVEFLLTSPEYPIKRLGKDGVPIYALNPLEYETSRSIRYVRISDAAVAFSDKVRDLFNGADIFLTSDILVKWLNAFIEYPDKADIRHMSEIYYAAGSSHREYFPLFCQQTRFSDWVRSPRKTIRLLKRLTWRNPWQTFLICIFSPINVKRGNVFIFPRLNNKYLELSFKLFKKCKCRLVIGNRFEN